MTSTSPIRTLTNSNAPVKLENVGGLMEVHNNFGQVDASGFGKIVSEMPVTAAGELSSQSLTGQIGNGACQLNHASGNGNIEILNAAKKR